ncbi:MAG: LCP family protein [Candidatus Geothermincolia bacterium]
MGRTQIFGERRMKKRRFAFEITLLVLLVLVTSMGYIAFNPIKSWAKRHYARVRLMQTHISESQDPDAYSELTKWHDPSEPLNVLAVGIDRGSNPGETGNFRSDVMIVASIDLIEKRIALVSIPRDTKVTVPGYGTEKVNAAHSFGGAKLAMQVVKELSGLEIHGFMRVDFEAFQRMVDAMGGVPFTLPYDIQDNKAGYLGQGYYEALTGEQALTVVRSRDLPNGDLDRIENQHKFLKAVMEKALTLQDRQALLNMLDAAIDNIETTLTPDQILTVAECLEGIAVQNVQMGTVPGGSPRPAPGSPWYFVNDPVGTAELFASVRLYCAVTPPVPELPTDAAGEVDRGRINIKVLNGTRQTGIAAAAVAVLTEAGYNSLNPANSKNRYALTTIYYAAGYEDYGRQVAADLSEDREFVLEPGEQVTRAWSAEVVVVLGEDY